jgi:hypothetical protein
MTEILPGQVWTSNKNRYLVAYKIGNLLLLILLYEGESVPQE